METFTLNNGILKAVFLSYGAILHELWIKNKNGSTINIIQGLQKPEDYLNDSWSRGAIIGRYAGRLENPIMIEEKSISIENNQGVLLHGGQSGWNTKEWEVIHDKKPNSIRFKYRCNEGNSGFPGNIEAEINYTLKDNRICLDYFATTDAPTHINLTNHAYFNLNKESTINNHELKIFSDEILELKKNQIPTGKKISIKNSKYDYNNRRVIGKNRLDDYFVIYPLEGEVGNLYQADSGIEMKIYTDQPGLVVFTPLHFDGICFETQKFSNTPNISSFPSTLVRPGKKYIQRTQFEFNLKT